MLGRQLVSIVFMLVFFAGVFVSCAGDQRHISLRGKQLTLVRAGEPLQVGKTLPEVLLPGTDLAMVELKSLRGKVTLVSVVPSLDTPTCEEQTHFLSEKNEGLDKTANLVTISRDLPFAQKRFAKEAKIGNILFLSDYREAEFWKSAGLLIEESRLLARAIIVLDREGIIRYLEIVPELAQLPKMMEAFNFAKSLQ